MRTLKERSIVHCYGLDLCNELFSKNRVYFYNIGIWGKALANSTSVKIVGCIMDNGMWNTGYMMRTVSDDVERKGVRGRGATEVVYNE